MPTSKEVQCTELLNTNSATIDALSSQIKSTKGALSVLVHPFYSEDTSSFSDHRFVQSEYLVRRDKFLKASLASNIPLLIFEQGVDYLKLPGRLKPYGNGSVYTVKTEQGKHKPIGGDESWKLLSNTLTDAGVKRIILGGMYLMTYKSEITQYFDTGYVVKQFTMKMPELTEKYPFAARWLKKDLVPIGCVGHAAIQFLNNGFDVSLSSVATPCSGTGYFPMKLVPNDEDF